MVKCLVSDHWPIKICINLSTVTSDQKDSGDCGNKRLLWREASSEILDKYQECLETKLNMKYIQSCRVQ